jgi:hypothetical protein
LVGPFGVVDGTKRLRAQGALLHVFHAAAACLHWAFPAGPFGVVEGTKRLRAQGALLHVFHAAAGCWHWASPVEPFSAVADDWCGWTYRVTMSK